MSSTLPAVLQLFALAVAGELVLYVAAPGLMSRLAVIPIGPDIHLRKDELGDSFRFDAQESAYRTGARPRLALGGRAKDFSLSRLEYSAFLDAKRECIVFWINLRLGPGQNLGIGRLDLHPENDGMRVRPRYFPVGMLSFGVPLLGGLILGAAQIGFAKAAFLIVVFGSIAAITAVLPRGRIRRVMHEVLNDVRLPEASTEEPKKKRRKPKKPRRLRPEK